MTRDLQQLRTELHTVEEEAARRLAALDKAFQVIFDDWCEGRGYKALTMADLVDQAVARVDETDPEPRWVGQRRLSVMREAAELFLAGSRDARETLETEIGGSPALVWAVKEYLDGAPSDGEELARLLAMAAMVAGTEDNRDLLVRLVEILREAEERGVPTDAEANRVESLAGPPGAELLRRLRERDSNEW